jgi:hypothetical protein
MAAYRLQSFVKLMPQAFVVERILVDQERRKIVPKYTAGSRSATQQAPGISEPSGPVFSGDEYNRHIDVTDRTAFLATG